MSDMHEKKPKEAFFHRIMPNFAIITTNTIDHH